MGIFELFNHFLNFISAKEKERDFNSPISGIIDSYLTKHSEDPYIQRSLENRHWIDTHLRVLKKTVFWSEEEQDDYYDRTKNQRHKNWWEY